MGTSMCDAGDVSKDTFCRLVPLWALGRIASGLGSSASTLLPPNDRTLFVSSPSVTNAQMLIPPDAVPVATDSPSNATPKQVNVVDGSYPTVPVKHGHTLQGKTRAVIIASRIVEKLREHKVSQREGCRLE